MGGLWLLTNDKTLYLQVLCPRGPVAAYKGGGHGRGEKENLGIEIQVTFAVIIGVADAQCPGAVAVVANLLDIGGVPGGHATAGVGRNNFV